MQNTTNLCPEIIGADIRGLVESLAGDAVFQLISQTIVIGNQSLRMESIDNGGRCRIRTHVSGSEGRKDIQTTLIARIYSDKQLLLEEVCSTKQTNG